MKTNRYFVIATAILLVVFVMAGVIIMLNVITPTAAANITTHSYSSDQPFFNDYLDNVYKVDNETSIDKWYDTLPKTSNTTNFCSLGTTEYQNINGRTVLVDTFYRHPGDSLNDPNYGQGILIYQAIQYKVAHPNDDVEIYFGSYRMSATASVCIDKESKYFGYMRSLFDCEYDNHGFVRISFMLVEAARMGIKVVLIPQLNSYGVNQYSATAAKKYAYKSALQYRTYFNGSLDRACYTSYAEGKSVSDYLVCAFNDWNVEERGGDMQHLKACLVSNYRDYDGVDHEYGMFFESANLDENDYLGRNGNSGAQSGVIITNHKEMYNCCRNYMDLIAEYRGSNDIIKFRDIVSSRQTQQIDLFYEGQYNTVPENQRLCYLGSETDSVFELYFTPLSNTSIGVWNTKYMPYCRYLAEMLKSDDYIVFTWNMPYSENTNQFTYTIEDVIYEAFHKNQNKNNRLYMHFETFDATRYNDLTVGKNIGFKNVNTNLKTYIHSKDMIMSYSLNHQRKYVSIISSCNFGNWAFWYRANSILVVKETDENHGTYSNLGGASTYGCI